MKNLSPPLRLILANLALMIFAISSFAISEFSSPMLTGDCDSAIELDSGVQIFGATTGGELCTTPCELAGVEVLGSWYRIYSETCSTISFNLTNVSAETVSMTIYAQPASSTGCDDLEAIACCPAVVGTCAGDVSAIYALQPDSWVYMMVYTPNGDTQGEFSLIATCEILGCTDPSSCNYDPDATMEDYTCTYELCPPDNDDITGAISLTCNVVLETSNGGASTDLPIDSPDCMDSSVYGTWYSFEGTGELHTLTTCGSIADAQVHIFNSDDNTPNGVLTCATDAITGLPLVEIDDGQVTGGCGWPDVNQVHMTFQSVPGITYYVLLSSADQFSWGLVYLELQCETFVPGCMNEFACNYDSTANYDDDSCDFFSCACGPECPSGTPAVIKMYDEFGDGWNGAYYTITLQDDTISTGTIDEAPVQVNMDNFTGPEYGEEYFCFCEESCYEIVVIGGAWDSEISWEIFTDQDVLLAEGIATSGQFFTLGAGLICGCTDPSACNFDPLANSDPGACVYEGCILGGDLNGDGMVNTEDLLNFIADWGCEGPDCIGDINADGVVNTLDLMALLINF